MTSTDNPGMGDPSMGASPNGDRAATPSEPHSVAGVAGIPSADDYEVVFVPMLFERVTGRDLAEWRENVCKTELYRRGDTVLVWVNEGDLYCDGPFVKHWRRKREASAGEASGQDAQRLDAQHEHATGNADAHRSTQEETSHDQR